MPHNFSFVIEGVLAGMERPGTFAKFRNDLEFLQSQNVRAIVSLTERPLEKAFIEEFGFRCLHLPVEDFTPPTEEQIRRFLELLQETEAAGYALVVHCGAGLGRTGTMLACYLVRGGAGAEEAIAQVRAGRPGAVEPGEQEEAVRQYERRVKAVTGCESRATNYASRLKVLRPKDS
jgi:atypical dual specificity phosphatase